MAKLQSLLLSPLEVLGTHAYMPSVFYHPGPGLELRSTVGVHLLSYAICCSLTVKILIDFKNA